MKSIRKTVLFLLMSLLIIAALPLTGSAKKTVKKRSVTISVDSTYTFTLKNVSRATWKTSNKKIVSLTVKKKGTKAIFHGNKAGKAKVTATTDKVQHIFYVTVKATTKKKTSKTTSSKMSYHMKGNGTLMVFYVKSTYSIPKKVTITSKFYNKNGKKMGSKSCSVLCLGPKRQAALSIVPPKGYASYKNSMKVTDSSHTSRAHKIKVSSSKDSDGVTAFVSNKSGRKLKKIKLAVVYYNSNGKEIGYKSASSDCTAKGSTDSVDFDFPKDTQGVTVVPSRYKLYVVEAY